LTNPTTTISRSSCGQSVNGFLISGLFWASHYQLCQFTVSMIISNDISLF